MAKAKRNPQFCLHCGKQIQRDKVNAACGWRHIVSKKVICDPTDATPMGRVKDVWVQKLIETFHDQIQSSFQAGYNAGKGQIQVQLRRLFVDLQILAGISREEE